MPEDKHWKELPRPETAGAWSWRYHFRSRTSMALNSEQDEGVLFHQAAWAPTVKDAAAIAALPDYVAEVERLRAVIDDIEEALNNPDISILPEYFNRVRARAFGG